MSLCLRVVNLLFEHVMRELQYQGPDVLREEIKPQLARISDVDPDLWQFIEEEVYLRIGFVHRWQIEAHVMGKTKEELHLQAIIPNHVRLPGLYPVGEAFSLYQEGTLWTTDRAAALIAAENASATHSHSLFNQPVTLTKNEDGKLMAPATNPKILVYKGQVIDAAAWVARQLVCTTY